MSQMLKPFFGVLSFFLHKNWPFLCVLSFFLEEIYDSDMGFNDYNNIIWVFLVKLKVIPMKFMKIDKKFTFFYLIKVCVEWFYLVKIRS
jgi:hypothetical protein